MLNNTCWFCITKKIHLNHLLIHIARNNRSIKMADQSQNLSFQAGEAKGHAQVKKDDMMDKARDAAQSAKESCQEAGQQIKATAQGAADAVKDATGMNKKC